MNNTQNLKTTHLLKELLDLNESDTRAIEKCIQAAGYNAFLDNLEKFDLSVELLVKLQIFRELAHSVELN